MALEGSKPQFSKQGLATKMALQVDSSNFFHSERIEIDEKQHNDPIHITDKSFQVDLGREVHIEWWYPQSSPIF
jgi:hypothetical protein